MPLCTAFTVSAPPPPFNIPRSAPEYLQLIGELSYVTPVMVVGIYLYTPMHIKLNNKSQPTCDKFYQALLQQSQG